MEMDTGVPSLDKTHSPVSASHCQPVQDDYVTVYDPANDADVRGMCSLMLSSCIELRRTYTSSSMNQIYDIPQVKPFEMSDTRRPGKELM